MDKRILDAAQEAAPETMAKVAELVSQIGPEFLEDVFQEFDAISEMTLEKSAGVSDFVKTRIMPGALKGAVLVGVAGAAALGTSIAADLFDAAKRGLTKDRNFKRIMKYAPQLRGEVSDPGRIKPAFDALHRYAPDFTADPMLGASLLKSLVNQPPGNEHVLITALLNSRKTLGEIKNNQFKPDFRAGKKDSDLTFEQRIALEKAKPAEQHLHQPPGAKTPRGFGGGRP